MRVSFARVSVALLFCVIAGSSCETIPREALKLNKESLELRQMQTRRFDTNDEVNILAACAALIQDLGFILDESETGLGVVVGSKARSAVNAGEVTAAVLCAIVTGVAMPTSKDQMMRACIVTRPFGEQAESVTVRVTFQRIVRNTQNQVTVREGLTDPEMYQEFFEKLSKAVFLEAHEI